MLMKKPPIATSFANVFGALGYLSCLTQWLWAFVVVLLPRLDTPEFRHIFLPTTSPEPAAPAYTSTLPPVIQTIFLILAVVFTLGVIIYAIVSVPRAIGRAGSKVTHQAAEIAVKQITHTQHKPLTKTQEKTFIERITWSVKLAAVLLPMAALLIPSAPGLGLTRDVILAFGGFCAAITLVWFTVQYCIAKFARLDPRTVW